MAGPAGEPVLVIGASARTLRHTLGVLACAAFEEVLLDAAPRPSGDLSAQVSAGC